MVSFLAYDLGIKIRRSGDMRSLWRRLALRWLGGAASPALDDGDGPDLLDTLLCGPTSDAEIIRVTRVPGVSHRALLREATAADPVGTPLPEE